jgi:hypothetical protein
MGADRALVLTSAPTLWWMMSDESNAATRTMVASYFVESNLDGEPQEVLSPSGRYRLVIRSYRTAPGRWNYTRGTVTRVVDEQDAWWEQFQSTDPMYQRLVERVRSLFIPCEWGWQPTGHRINQSFRRITPRASADLHWDVDARIVKLQLYTPAGNRDREVSFEHSVAGIDACVEVLAALFRRGDATEIVR